MLVCSEKIYIFALLLFGCKSPPVKECFSYFISITFFRMSKFFFSVFISVVLTSLEIS